MIVIPLILILAVQSQAQRMQFTPEQRVGRLRDSLNLDSSQIKGILTIFENTDSQRKAIPDSVDRQQRMQLIGAMMDSADVKIEALLTAPQKEKYESMKKQRRNFRRRE